MTSTVPASMGGPLSEAERIAEIRARFEATFVQPAGYDPTAIKADAERLAVADADLRERARDDIEFLLRLVGVLEGQLAEIRENQLGLARGFLHDAEAQHQRAGNAPSSDTTAVRAAGTVHGAVTALQVLLVTTGEVEYDEEADAVWDLVARKDGNDSAKALGLDGGDPDER